MWDRISALATVVAIPVSIWLAIWGIRARRESEGHLNYEFITGIRLLVLEAAQLTSEIKVVCGDQLIADPYLLLVRIINVGRERSARRTLREKCAPSGWINRSVPLKLSRGVILK